jgi:hypothetical protein
MPGEQRRRFVPLPESIIEEAVKVSERVGVPYLVLIEKILQANLGIMKYKPTILKALLIADAIDDLRRTGSAILPWGFVKYFLDRIGEDEFVKLLGEVEKTCMWFGEVMRVKHGSSPGIFEASLSALISSAFIDVLQEGDGSYRYVVSFMDQSQRALRLAEGIAVSLARGFHLNIIDVKRESNTVSIRVTGFFEKE